MSNSLDAKARALLVSLNVPKGSVSIMPTQDGGNVRLFVFVDRDYWYLTSRIPPSFEGLDVVVKVREAWAAQRNPQMGLG